jgi:hypothetical protein
MSLMVGGCQLGVIHLMGRRGQARNGHLRVDKVAHPGYTVPDGGRQTSRRTAPTDSSCSCSSSECSVNARMWH